MIWTQSSLCKNVTISMKWFVLSLYTYVLFFSPLCGPSRVWAFTSAHTSPWSNTFSRRGAQGPWMQCCWAEGPALWLGSSCCPSPSLRHALKWDPSFSDVFLVWSLSKVVITSVQCGRYSYGSVVGALRSVCRSEGPGALFSGLGATLLRDVPFSGIYVMFYSQAKGALPTGER